MNATQNCLGSGTRILSVFFMLALAACHGGGGGPPANRAPVVSGPTQSTAGEDDADYVVSQSDLLANASDADGDSLSVSGLSIVNGNAAGVSVNGTTVDVSPGAYNSLTTGMDEVIDLVYTVNDGKGGTAVTGLEITITGSNDAPSRVALSNVSVSDGQPSAGGFTVGTLYADDPEGDTSFDFSIAGGADAANFSVAGDELLIDDGVLQASAKNRYDVTVRATDSGGAGTDADLAVLVIESDPLAVGYYDLLRNIGRPEQATPITFIGETAIDVGDIATADLSIFDMLFFQNPNSGPPAAPYSDQANLDKVADFVNNGGMLVFHDRNVATIENFLPGSPGNLVQDLGATRTEFEVIDELTHLALGPGGVIDDNNLESANSLTFGYVDADTVPHGSIGLLSRNDPDHWTTYAYPYGRGWVLYSSIPLDFYLLSGNPDIMRDVYAPNILAEARAILGKAPDDDGDGLLNAEEALLGTDSNSADSDGDTLSDFFEVRNGFDPTSPGDEAGDTDADGLSNFEEQTAGTSPRLVDSDDDGLGDGEEVQMYGTDPLSRDSDGDLLSDGDEILVYFTDPTAADTDTGGTDDGRELLVDQTDPLDANDDVPTTALPLTLTDGNGFIWDIQQDGNIINGTQDAYDGGMRLLIDNSSFPTFSLASSRQSGRELAIGLARMSGLDVTRRIYVPSNRAFVRYMEVLDNPTAADISVSLTINTNLGSDGGTVIVSTSDGDAVIEPTDFYVVTDDAGDGSGDPSLAHVVGGPNGALLPTITAPLGSILYTYDVTIPANDRLIVMHFDSQNANRSSAISSAQSLVVLSAGTLDGVTAEELADIVNF